MDSHPLATYQNVPDNIIDRIKEAKANAASNQTTTAITPVLCGRHPDPYDKVDQ
jgi:hypothetical protein